MQPSLFDLGRSSAPVVGPTGLHYRADVLSRAEERDAVAAIAELEFKPFAFRGFTGNRRTVSFGWRYDFNGGGFQAAAPQPPFVRGLRARAAALAGVEAEALQQCSIIEYAPGAGIGWHRDRPQFGTVVGLSLLSTCRLRLRRERSGGGWERASLELAPHSGYVLDGEARSLWQHSIPPLHSLRYSVTFRTLSALGASLVTR
jgi:alkylated DNA repair dioxygenase AlkB